MSNRTIIRKVYLTEEESEFYDKYSKAKEYRFSQLCRYALKRLTSTNKIKGLKGINYEE